MSMERRLRELEAAAQERRERESVSVVTLAHLTDDELRDAYLHIMGVQMTEGMIP